MMATEIVYNNQKESGECLELMLGHFSLVMNVLESMDSTQLTQDLLMHLNETSHFLRESLDLDDNKFNQAARRAAVESQFLQAQH